MVKKKVLLAEDDGDDNFFFVYFLEERVDISILNCVENGLEVIQFLDALANNEDLPDFILLDQNMPKMNGLETLKYLKGNARYASIPVFVYSTYADQNLAEKCGLFGAALVHQKPTDKEGYNKMIDACIEMIDNIA